MTPEIAHLLRALDEARKGALKKLDGRTGLVAVAGQVPGEELLGAVHFERRDVGVPARVGVQRLLR
jgi:hypothetical protein